MTHEEYLSEKYEMITGEDLWKKRGRSNNFPTGSSCTDKVIVYLHELMVSLRSVAEMEVQRARPRREIMEPLIRDEAIKIIVTGIGGWDTYLKVLSLRFQWSREDLLKEVITRLKKKHSDYGNASLIRYGVFGFLVKLHQKVDRLENLIGDKGPLEFKATQNEPVEDTWLDVCGYGILLLMYGRGELE